MTADLPRAVRPGRRLQRADRGECRRHARRAGLRQRGPRARAVRPRQRPLPRRPSCEAYRIMAASTSLTYLGMRLTQMVGDDRRRLVRAARRADRRAASSSFLLLVGVFFRPVEKINAVLETYPKGIAGFRRYTELLDTEPDIVDAPDAVDVGRAAGRHPLRGRALRLQRRSGRCWTASTSRSAPARRSPSSARPAPARRRSARCCRASTSSTRAASPSTASTSARMTLASLRGQIGIVQQDVFLFAGTVRENIAYGRLDATEAEIWDAARRARLDERDPRDMPDGLDTVIGERGVKLSGGQKQRLAIARMFLKNPPILILDEATSALDTETERAIQQSLAELARGPHHAGHRPPPGHHPQRRPHRGRGRDRRRRTGPPPRPARRRRRLPPPARGAARGLRKEGQGLCPWTPLRAEPLEPIRVCWRGVG